jgi:two-component system sensor histidine kinase BaeS
VERLCKLEIPVHAAEILRKEISMNLNGSIQMVSNMKISIQYKLFAAMLFATLSVVGLMTIVIQWSFDRGFLEYVNIEEQEEINRLAQQLEEYYSQHQTWQGLLDNPLEVLKIHALTLPKSKTKHRANEFLKDGKIADRILHSLKEKDERRRHPIQRTLILDINGGIIFGQKLEPKLPHLIPLMYNEKQVGSIGLYPPKKFHEVKQLMFVERQNSVVLMAGIAAVIITVGISLLLAYSLTKPIRKLSFAANKLIEGDYSIRISNNSRDELERLSSDFNTLATTLEENEVQRKLWVSDIAHELRTPLTSLKGEIEALQDGIRSPGQRTYDNLHKGVVRLERLVEDLYDLNRSDIGAFTLMIKQIDLCSLVESEVATFQQAAKQAGLRLLVNNTINPIMVPGDMQRLQQLISNLLTNSIRYTDRGGLVTVSVRIEDSFAVIEVEDTAPGVPDDALPRLFNRLYRVERSRNRALGGSGLGLAICQQIAHAHRGSIVAQHSAAGGLHITVSLPLTEEITA